MILTEIFLVYFQNSVGSFIKLLGLVKNKSSIYTFTFLNTGRSNLPETHWWRILNIYLSKQLFLFDSYGVTGLKAFIIQGNRNIINQILYGTESLNKKKYCNSDLNY